jgi:hypothetical protein
MYNQYNKKYSTEEERKAAHRRRDKKYRDSEKGKLTRERYDAAHPKEKKPRIAHNKKYYTEEERKAARSKGNKKYRNSEKGKNRIQSWFESEIGKVSKEKYNSGLGKEYYKNNKKEITRKNTTYQINRRKNDPKTKLVAGMSSLLRTTLDKRNGKKNIHMSKLIGCTRPELYKWIEQQFYKHKKTKEEMTWFNRGVQKIGGKKKWHIDHIIPLSRIEIDKPETIVFVCHFTNLRPLWADENMAKSNKFTEKEKNKILWRVSNVLGEKGYGEFTSDEILKEVK